MNRRSNDSTAEPAAALGSTVPLSMVRDDLAVIEALECEVATRVSVLRATLSPEQFRLVWELRDTEQRLGLAEQDLNERRLVDGLARHLPECAATIRTVARQLLDADGAPSGPHRPR